MIAYDILENKVVDDIRNSTLNNRSLFFHELGDYVPLTPGMMSAHKLRQFLVLEEIRNIIKKPINKFLREIEKDVIARKDKEDAKVLRSLMSDARTFLSRERSSRTMKSLLIELMENLVNIRHADVIYLNCRNLTDATVTHNKLNLPDQYARNYPDAPIIQANDILDLSMGCIRDSINQSSRIPQSIPNLHNYINTYNSHISKVSTRVSTYIMGGTLIVKTGTGTIVPVMVMGVKKGKEKEVILNYIETGKMDKRYVKAFFSPVKNHSHLRSHVTEFLTNKGYKTEVRKESIVGFYSKAALAAKPKEKLVSEIKQLIS